ncbi:MAG: hypothetical protein IIY04_00235 [Oscillospiraceae bacterium]|nr:hypothetical protein [Oscillospiraceae bacterium]
MTEYEILIEEINPCGGAKHAKRSIVEAEAESPEAYLAENARFAIMDVGKNAAGDVVITTGDGSGNMVRYTFTE